MLSLSRSAAACLLIPALLVLACEDSSGPQHEIFEIEADADAGADADRGEEAPYPYPPARSTILPLDGQVLFPVHLDGSTETHHLVVDTGASRTVVDETLLRDVHNGVGLATIDFGHGIVLEDFEAIAADLSLAIDHIGVRLDGLIGQDLFGAYFFGLDYRNSEVTMAGVIPAVPPPGFTADQAIAVDYSLEQLLPMVAVDISGGQTANLIADTGSGVTLVTESSVPAVLLSSGVTGYVWHTSYGSDPATLVRLPELTIGGHAVADTWVAVVPDEYHLKQVFDLLGVQVDGFLGFPVYRRFYVAVHGSESRYLFYPYPDLSHVPTTEWDRVGIELKREDGAVVIDMVFSPSDAATQGVQPGDRLVAIDDQALDGRELDEIRLMLRGAPGETHALVLIREAAPLELTVAVDRLLEPL